MRRATISFTGLEGEVAGKPVVAQVYYCSATEYADAEKRDHVTAWYTAQFHIQPGGYIDCAVECTGPDTCPLPDASEVVSTRDIYILAGCFRERTVLAHELDHARGLDHPNTLLSGILDAWRRGWPMIAFTALLRWNDPSGALKLADQVYAAMENL